MMSLPSASWTSMVDSGVNIVRIAVQVRAEQHAFFGDLAQRVETENLESARIGEDRPGPVHELVQAAELADGLVAGPEEQMIGIAQDDLGVQIVQQIARAGCP